MAPIVLGIAILSLAVVAGIVLVARRLGWLRRPRDETAHGDGDNIAGLMFVNAMPKIYRDGMGIFSADTLDSEASLRAHRHEAAQLRLSEQADLDRRVRDEIARRRARWWAWLPWSRYRRAVVAEHQALAAIAERGEQHQRDRAEAYKSMLQASAPELNEMIYRAIDDGVTDRAPLLATAPTDDDDDTRAL